MNKKLIIIISALFITCGIITTSAQKKHTISPELEAEIAPLIDQIMSDPEQGEIIMNKNILKKYKKDRETLISIGYYFLDNNLFGECLGIAHNLYEKDPSFIPAIYLEGDAYSKIKKYGEASTKYEEARALKPDDMEPYVKLVEVYKYVNPEYAMQLVDELSAQKGEDPDANRVLGSLYYQLNDTTKSIKAFNTYFASCTDGNIDLKAREDYAVVMFLSKNYKTSLDMVKKILPEDPEEISLNRMLFYNNIELEDYDAANSAYNEFFVKNKDKYFDLYNYSDYKYAGIYFTKLKKYPEAVEAYKSAVEIVPEDRKDLLAQMYGDLSNAYQKTNQYDEAAEAFQNYMDTKYDKETDLVNDKFNKGKIYYYGVVYAVEKLGEAQTDTTKYESMKRRYLEEGTKLFNDVTVAKADSYLGPSWVARLNMLATPETPNEVAKAAFEEVIKRLDGKGEDYDSKRAEAFAYISWSYVNTEDWANARIYCDKALKCDEYNNLASQINRALKGAGK